LTDHPFPITRHSVVQRLGSESAEERERALETLVASYWKPVYKYVRLRWHKEPVDAEDLTQEFFASAVEKEFLASYDPARARFRTFLRVCVDRTVQNYARSSARLKRGGRAMYLSIDVITAEDELQAIGDGQADMDEFFRRESIRSLFELAVDRLRAECESTGKQVQFAIFEQYDISGLSEPASPSYAKLAELHSIPETQVTNYLAFARRRLRHHVLAVLSEITASDAELAAEAREVFGLEIA
jgi:RNA polymerase sigma factor (sigma-70 family)